MQAQTKKTWFRILLSSSLFLVLLIGNTGYVNAQTPAPATPTPAPTSPTPTTQTAAERCKNGEVQMCGGALAEKVGLSQILSIGKIFSFASDILLAPFGWLALLVLQLTSLITTFAGILLNLVVDYTIVSMKAHIQGAAVDQAWSTIRDVANMGFIFVLLYAAIKHILGIGKGAQGLIVKIIVVAILINFSLFATKIVIDSSNILAMTFYDAIAPGALSQQHSTLNVGLSNSLMEPLRIQSLMSDLGPLDGKKIIIVGVMGSIFSLIAAFVFFAISLLLIIRFVVLVFVMILSPIAFVAFILPGMSAQKKMWTDALLNQAFFAPVYFMLTWVVILVTKGLFPPDNTMSMGKALSFLIGGDKDKLNIAADAGGIQIFMNFIIIIAFLIASLLISKKMADKAGPGFSSLSKSVMGYAGSASFGLAGNLSRRSFGRLGQAVSENETLKRNMPTSRLARLAVAAGKKTGSSSFDLRGTGVGSTVGAGSPGGKGGYKQSREDSIKKRMEQVKDMESKITGEDVETEMTNRRWDNTNDQDWLRHLGLSAAQIAGINANGLSKQQVEDLGLNARQTEAMRRHVQADLVEGSESENTRRKEEFNHNISQTTFMRRGTTTDVEEDAEAARRLRGEPGENKKGSARFAQLQRDVMDGHTAARTPGGNTDDLEKALARANDKEIEAIVKSNRELLQSQEFANSISVRQLEALVKSEEFSDNEKDTLKGARFSEINTAVTAGGPGAASVGPRIKGLTDGELEMIDPNHLDNEEFVGQLRPAQIDAINKSNKFTRNQKSRLRDHRRAPLLAAINSGDVTATAAILKRFSPKDIASLDMAILTNPTALPAFNPSMLKLMRLEMTPANVSDLRDAIINQGGNANTIAWLQDPDKGMQEFI